MDEHAKWHTCKRRSQIIASPPPPPPTPMHSREVDRQSRTGLIYVKLLRPLVHFRVATPFQFFRTVTVNRYRLCRELATCRRTACCIITGTHYAIIALVVQPAANKDRLPRSDLQESEPEPLYEVIYRDNFVGQINNQAYHPGSSFRVLPGFSCRPICVQHLPDGSVIAMLQPVTVGRDKSKCRQKNSDGWNSLPAHLRSPLISRGQFRAGLKTHLFKQAYSL